MDAQYPFASRDDIWRVLEELKEVQAAQIAQAERIARLERRRDEDARLKSVWGPLSPFPSSIGGSTVPAEPVYTSPADAFKGFDQGQHHGMVNSMTLDTEDEPRRGTSRANSVRFDESAIHGYYGQASRSSSELPLRTGSGMGSHPLTERSLSHRSDGRQSSSGQSHHSARTNSMGMETTSRMMSSTAGSPLIPPPGLFLLGPVPCIIRCWLTTKFSNDSLLYAAVCSGSYTSSLGYPMVRRLGLEDQVMHEEDAQYLKVPLYLPEASVSQASSRSSSPVPQLPALTIRFLLREVDPSDPSIQIVIGSDVLRSHNADVLFSQDKMILVDDDRNKVSVPLVRPEDDAVFKFLGVASDMAHARRATQTLPLPDQTEITNDHSSSVGVIGQPPSRQSRSTSASARGSSLEEPTETRKARPLEREPPRSTERSPERPQPTVATESQQPSGATKPEPAGVGVWGTWKRDGRLDSSASAAGRPSRGRAMKVLRPTKSSTRTPQPTTNNPSSSGPENMGFSMAASQPASSRASPDEPRSGKPWAPNPVGGASAFGWLNSSQAGSRAATNPK